MPLNQTRAKLAQAQLALVQALTRQTDGLDDFDPVRLRAAANALVLKRARTLARAWPALSRSLGGNFWDRFGEFAATTPVPSCGGPLADGRAFARFLKGRGELPDEGRLEATAVDLRYAPVRNALVPRRMPSLRIAWFTGGLRLVLAIRVPWVGEWWWIIGRKG